MILSISQCLAVDEFVWKDFNGSFGYEGWVERVGGNFCGGSGSSGGGSEQSQGSADELLPLSDLFRTTTPSELLEGTVPAN